MILSIKTISTAVKLENYSKTTSLSKLLVDGAVPVTQTAFPRCTAMLRHCIKNENERSSAVELAMWHPSSWRKSNANSPTVPRVSTAMPVKSYSGGRLLYFDFFQFSCFTNKTAVPFLQLNQEC